MSLGRAPPHRIVGFIVEPAATFKSLPADGLRNSGLADAQHLKIAVRCRFGNSRPTRQKLPAVADSARRGSPLFWSTF
jgi:hypothetical protein